MMIIRLQKNNNNNYNKVPSRIISLHCVNEYLIIKKEGKKKRATKKNESIINVIIWKQDFTWPRGPPFCLSAAPPFCLSADGIIIIFSFLLLFVCECARVCVGVYEKFA